MIDRRTIPITLLLAVTLWVAVPCLAAPLQETFTKTVPLAAGGRVSLGNINGEVRISAWDQAEVKIEAIKEASSKEYLDRLVIDVKATADSVRIDTRYPSSDGFHGLLDSREQEGGTVAYTLSVPRGARLDKIDLVNSSLEVNGVEGGVIAELVNGTITAKGLGGRIELETVNGAIDLACDRATAKDTIRAESVNGTIEIAIPAALGVRVQSQTVNGHLSNELGIEVVKHKWVGAEMNGSVGDGAVSVTLETVNGSIRVRKL